MDNPQSTTQLTETDLTLLSDFDREWDWASLESVADRLRGEPGGWELVAVALSKFQDMPEEEQDYDARWILAPACLALIGQKSDEPTRQAIASELLDALGRCEEYDDMFVESLIHATMALGPAILPVVAEYLRESDPTHRGWMAMQNMLDLGASDDATVSQQAVAIETAEWLLRQAEAGELPAVDVEFAGWSLAYLRHTPSVGLLGRVARLAEQSPRGSLLGKSELSHAHEMLTGKVPTDKPYSIERIEKGIEPIFKSYWDHTINFWQEIEEELQNEFEQDLAELTDNLPFDPEALFEGFFDQMQPTQSRKVGRNEPCPCGSGKKYKKCCGPRMR